LNVINSYLTLLAVALEGRGLNSLDSPDQDGKPRRLSSDEWVQGPDCLRRFRR
jgi:hypothetical protein